MLNITKLRNQLDYNPETGVFKWRETGSGRRKDLVAGCVKSKRNDRNVWCRIVFDGQEYTSGQLAWALMTGEFPDFIIDHIDQDPLNDKWSNLRRGDACVDQRNNKKSIRNKTGVVGVKFHKTSSKYHAFIGAGGKQKYLGSSDDFFEAVCMRKRAEIEYKYSPNHGL
ncbi:HNH endonuclease [Pseudoalteromonas sp. Of11M-6]|uniref:HNH endonuclease n=1 Tax=Pseudoalteromonas sp. Of11M-6 TaxID=2917754 RepID=UPI001EF4BF01|nr:HNH endonuclease [Pseudoalteromonas sp. Of11M-6]MCG7552091.1 HNH endonuclease [Pseudoalteromonas sp. Of11M-6]